MHFDWTFNVSNILAIIGALIAMMGVVTKLQEVAHKFDVRIVAIETWIENDGSRADKALGVLDTVGKSLERVTTLYEAIDGRVDRLQNSVEHHHTDLTIHRIGSIHDRGL